MHSALHDRKQRLQRRNEVGDEIVRRECGRPGRGVDHRRGCAPLAGDAVELRAAALEPPEAAIHRGARRGLVRLSFDQFVELHDQIGADVALDPHDVLGRVVVQRSVEVTAERDALFGDGAHLRQRVDLKAPRVGEHRAVPAREGVQPAERPHHQVARTEVEMEGVGEHHPSADRGDLLHREALDGAVRADGHECRRLDWAVRRLEDAGARGAVVMRGLKLEVGHPEEDR